KWDDHMEIYIGPAGEETMVWRGPYDYFPLDDNGVPNGQRCELKTSWEWNLNVDVTPYFKDVKVGDSVRFMIRAAVDGGGEAYARLRIDYDPTKVLSRDEWIPSSETCISSAKSTLDEMVDGGYECVDMPQLDANGCSNENGVIVCPSDMNEHPIDIHPLCAEENVDARFDFYHGQAECFIDRNGDDVCPVVEQSKERGEISSCKNYEEDPQCRFFSEECVEGAEGESGRCYVKSETWDCGEDVPYTDYESNEEIQCDGTFLCQGSECGIKPKTESTSFAKAATLLQASQFMQMDANCEEFSTETNNICEVFAGTDYECKRLAGGVVDCCDQPVEVTPAHYIRMMATVGVMEASFSMIDPSLPFCQAQGAYNALRDPIASSLSELTKPFTSAVETVTVPIKDATSEYLTEPVGNFLADLKAKASE